MDRGAIISVKTNKTKCVSCMQRMNDMVAWIQKSNKEKGIDRKRQQIEENKCRKLSNQMDGVSETNKDIVSWTKVAANDTKGKRMVLKKRERASGTEKKRKETELKQNKYVASTRQKGATMISHEVTNALARGGGRFIRKHMIMDAVITESWI